MFESSPPSLVDEVTPTGPRTRGSVARVLAYLLVIGIGLIGGMLLAIVAGLSMGWINFPC